MLIFIIFSLLIFFLIVFYSYRVGITPMPSHSKVVDILIEEIPSRRENRVVDLGSGWGILICRLAKKRPHNQFIGYEISPIPYFFSVFLKKVMRIKNLHLYRKDFRTIHLGQFDFIFCYLFTQAMRELEVKAMNEMKKQAILVSNTFAFPYLFPIKVIQIDNLYRSKLYFYSISKVGG